MLRIVFLLVFAIFCASSFGQEEQKPKTSDGIPPVLLEEIFRLQGKDRKVTDELQAAERKLNDKIEELQLKMQDAEKKIDKQKEDLEKGLKGADSSLNSKIYQQQRNLQAAERSLNSKIYQQQRNLQDLRSSGRITCDSVEDDYTNWQTGSHYSNRFLDRHHVICGTDEFLIGFKLQTRGSNEMRYAYQCCTIRIN